LQHGNESLAAAATSLLTELLKIDDEKEDYPLPEVIIELLSEGSPR
jgi:hypothetical protein